MRVFHRFWLLWVGLLGMALTAWSYMQSRAIHMQANPGRKAGWVIDVHLSVFHLVIARTGLLLIAVAVVVSVIRCVRTWIGSLRRT